MSPELFVLDDDGFTSIRELRVPPGFENAAWDGAANCPERAITIDEQRTP
jgi:ferredoxin